MGQGRRGDRVGMVRQGTRRKGRLESKDTEFCSRQWQVNTHRYVGLTLNRSLTESQQSCCDHDCGAELNFLRDVAASEKFPRSCTATDTADTEPEKGLNRNLTHTVTRASIRVWT